jgi:hypothetical protein
MHEQRVAGGAQVPAMGAPMMPRPIKPTLRWFAMFVSSQ